MAAGRFLREYRFAADYPHGTHFREQIGLNEGEAFEVAYRPEDEYERFGKALGFVI